MEVALGFSVVGSRRHMDKQVCSSGEGCELERGVLELNFVCAYEDTQGEDVERMEEW